MQLVPIHEGPSFSSKTEPFVDKDFGARLLDELSRAVDWVEPILQGTLSVPAVCNTPSAPQEHNQCAATRPPDGLDGTQGSDSVLAWAGQADAIR